MSLSLECLIQPTPAYPSYSYTLGTLPKGVNLYQLDAAGVACQRLNPNNLTIQVVDFPYYGRQCVVGIDADTIKGISPNNGPPQHICLALGRQELKSIFLGPSDFIQNQYNIQLNVPA